MQLLVVCGALGLISSAVVMATSPVRELSCDEKECGETEVCRYVQMCIPDLANSSLPHKNCTGPWAACVQANDSQGTRYGCRKGQPLLTKTPGSKHEQRVCFEDHECPKGYYCNTGRADASAICCPLLPPAPPTPKPGSCPDHLKDDPNKCVSENRTCQSDADCKGSTKCCRYNLYCPGKTCLPAKLQHQCDPVKQPCKDGYECRLVEECDSEEKDCSPARFTCVQANVSQTIDYGCLTARPLMTKLPVIGYKLRTCHDNNPCPGGFNCSAALADSTTRCCPMPKVNRMSTSVPLPPAPAAMRTPGPQPPAPAAMRTPGPLPPAPAPVGTVAPLPSAPAPFGTPSLLPPAPAPVFEPTSEPLH